MKKTIIIAAGLLVISLSSCKKDRTCACTYTYTSTSGSVTTSPEETTVYTKVKKSDAKSLCQKSTYVTVNSKGETSTGVNDCKLK